MIRKQISANFETVACDVCGRSLLRGEQADVFFDGGQRRNVCELCTVRAARVGWIRDGLEQVETASAPGRKRGSFMSRRRARNERETSDAAYTPPPKVERVQRAARQLPEQIDIDGDASTPAPVSVPSAQTAPTQPAADTLYEHRNVRGVPSNINLKIARALLVFNKSPHVRTVSGVSRTLGAPLVCVLPSQTESGVITIVVGWELSWYRYEVDLGDEDAGARLVTKGEGLDELEPHESVANATADENGLLYQSAA